MASIRDVAAAAGVSISTASRVLTGALAYRRAGAQAAADRVLAAVKRLDYRPNGAARAMQHGRFATIALIAPGGEHPGWLGGSFLLDLLAAAERADRRLLLGRLPSATWDSAATLPVALSETFADVLILDGSRGLDGSRALWTRRLGRPVIVFNRKGGPGHIFVDEYATGAISARWLLGRQHRRMGLVRRYDAAGDTVHYSRIDRPAGFTAVMAESSLKPDTLDLPASGAVDACMAWLARPERPTGVFAHDVLEAAVLRQAADRLGLRLGQDLDLVAVGDPREVVWPDQPVAWLRCGPAFAEATIAFALAAEAGGTLTARPIQPELISP